MSVTFFAYCITLDRITYLNICAMHRACARTSCTWDTSGNCSTHQVIGERERKRIFRVLCWHATNVGRMRDCIRIFNAFGWSAGRRQQHSSAFYDMFQMFCRAITLPQNEKTIFGNFAASVLQDAPQKLSWPENCTAITERVNVGRMVNVIVVSVIGGDVASSSHWIAIFINVIASPVHRLNLPWKTKPYVKQKNHKCDFICSSGFASQCMRAESVCECVRMRFCAIVDGAVLLQFFIVSLCRHSSIQQSPHWLEYSSITEDVGVGATAAVADVLFVCRYRHEIILCISFVRIRFCCARNMCLFWLCSWGFLSTEYSHWKP